MCHSRQNIGSGHLWWWPSLQWGWWHGWARTFSVHQGDMGWTALTWGWGSPSHGGKGCWGLLHSLMFLSLTAKSLDRSMAGARHTPTLSFLYHPENMKLSTRNFLQEHWPKDKETHLSLVCIPLWSYRQLEALHSHGRRDLHLNHHPCTDHNPTVRGKLPIAMEKGSSAPPIISVLDLPQNKCWVWWIHCLVLLVCAVILGKYLGTFPFAQVNLSILRKESPWTGFFRQTTSLTARTLL